MIDALLAEHIDTERGTRYRVRNSGSWFYMGEHQSPPDIQVGDIFGYKDEPWIVTAKPRRIRARFAFTARKVTQ